LKIGPLGQHPTPLDCSNFVTPSKGQGKREAHPKKTRKTNPPPPPPNTFWIIDVVYKSKGPLPKYVSFDVSFHITQHLFSTFAKIYFSKFTSSETPTIFHHYNQQKFVE